jgi:heavy metal sensor kinase
MWVLLRHNLYDIADDALESQVDDVQRILKAQRSDAKPSEIQAALSGAYKFEHAGDYLQIQDEHGNWLYRSSFFKDRNVAAIGPSQLQGRVIADQRLGRRPFRILRENLDINGRHYIVQTAIREGDVLETLSYFRRYLLLFAPLVLLAASAGGYWLSRRALYPVDALARTARNITGTNLSDRLEQLNTGDELQRLSDTLNEMLSRIEGAFLRVSQFTGDASHELRTPIALIRTEAEIALRKSRDETEYKEALRHILVEAERTTVLIETLLSLARADAGSESLHMQRIDLRAITLESAEEWSGRIAAQNLRFSLNVSASPLYVAGDAAALSRLLSILFDNAVKYTPTPGSIELTLEKKDQRAVIAVHDTGIGINAEDQSKIFDRFYRADKARSRELGGSGLGLSIAKWIIEQHRGHITVQSSPTNGSIFSIELPLYSDSLSISA